MIYLRLNKILKTFDDGPNEGTDSVLNALESEGIRATFFINSQNLYEPKRENAERNARRFVKHLIFES